MRCSGAAGRIDRLVQELWQGRQFAELADDGALRLEAERLEDLRLLALESRVEADLQLGGGPDLVDELEALVSARAHELRFQGDPEVDAAVAPGEWRSRAGAS